MSGRNASPPPRVRLPIAFDASALLAEATAFAAADWSAHFNAAYHNGGWSGITLRGVTDDPKRLYVGPSPSNDAATQTGVDTPALAACPRIAAALDAFRCPVRAVRLLRLAPGGVIDEHRDPDLSFADGAARVHIPLATGAAVEFYVDNERVVMAPGECWYLDLSLPHRVHNRGSAARIHVVLDLGVNDWLRAQIAAGDCPARTTAAPSGAEEFARFRERVFADAGLAARLRAPTRDDDFVAATVAEGAAAGCAFDGTDVRAAMAAAQRAWISQWLV